MIQENEEKPHPHRTKAHEVVKSPSMIQENKDRNPCSTYQGHRRAISPSMIQENKNKTTPHRHSDSR